MPPAASLLLLLCAAGLLASPAADSALDQNITATMGESVLFPKIPFAATSEWVFLGAQRTNTAGKDLMYYHHDPQIFKAYKGRIQPYNGTFLLMNVSRQDEGWYCQTRDLQYMSYHYIRVLDPVCNVSIVATQTDNYVFFHCRFTGKADTVVWSHKVPASQLLSGNHSLQIPSAEALGYVQCSVMCGERGWQHAVYNITMDGGLPRSRARWGIFAAVFASLLVPSLLLIVRYCSYIQPLR
ncbi:uncharacterized protein LOC144821549 [Lissotriton helveticus]